MIELKLNDSIKETVNQIHKNSYYHGLKDKGFTGNILLVVINLNTNKNLYSCIVKEYDNELNYKSCNNCIPASSEPKRKHNFESDCIFKRSRSDTKQN